MKLNLLPSHVTRAQGSKGLFVVGLAILLLCGFVTFMMIGQGNEAVIEANAKVAEQEPLVERAMGKSNMADTVISRATGIDRNLKLTAAMMEHNAVYVDLYRDVIDAIPSFYRINSMSAAPTGPNSCTVNLTGVLQTSQQFADLSAALYRMPGVTSVARSGFVDNRMIVPSLTEGDQIGTPVRPGQANLPSDSEERLPALIARAAGSATGFDGTSFGTDASPKSAMLGWSAIAITLQLSGRDIRTPNPRATIDQHSGSAGGGAPGVAIGFGGGR